MDHGYPGLVLAGGVDPEGKVARHGAHLVTLAVELGEGGRAVAGSGAEVKDGDEHEDLRDRAMTAVR